jgi:signal transduction histidine kinase
VSGPNGAGERRVPVEELRELFLFEALSEERLAWISEHGDVVDVPAGQALVSERDPARCFYVLLSGTIRMYRNVRGSEVELTRSGQRGAYAGASQFFQGGLDQQVYTSTVAAVTDVTVLALPAVDFAAKFREWFPMATHLLAGQAIGARNAAEIVGQRERLLALGELSAGLTHELNNPAAAAVRATSALRERVAGMRHKLAMLADGNIPPAKLQKLVKLQEEFVERLAKAPKLTAVEASDREDELGDWLEEHGIAGGWDVAPTLVAGGVALTDLDELAERTGDGFLEPAVRWLTYTVETETLMNEIGDAVGRISNLVGAAKQYSQLDRTPHRWIDIHEGLDATLAMLGAKIGTDIKVVKEYDRTLPEVPAWPAELNQVWTNLIDNAIGAMDGRGTLTIRTAPDDGTCVLVEIGDTGSGIPEEIRNRIFEPFFTTKPVGQGTGLGLDVSYRIVVKKHGGDIRVVSEPGDTRFQVRLPLNHADS